MSCKVYINISIAKLLTLIETTNKIERKEITKIFLSNKLSATLIIPIEIARRHGLEKPSHVIVEERPDGILIRRLEI
jgi:hypothetical protein